MPKLARAIYANQKTQDVEKFAQALRENSTNGGVFDSAAASDFIATASNQSTGIRIPDNLQTVLDESTKAGESVAVTRAILDGINAYEAQHGCSAPADVIEQALHAGYGTTNAAQRKYHLDSATSLNSDAGGLQPNRAVIAILSAMGEAIPFAHYLPPDIGSNEAVLAIMSHNAGNAYGRYAQGGLMDGSLSGDAYISSSRIHSSLPAAVTGAVTGKLTTVQSAEDTCDANAAAVKLLRGRSVVYVNGQIAAREVDSTGSGNSGMNGKIVIAGTEYAIGGYINTDTGVYALTTAPALPITVPVVVEGFVDYERAPELTPSIITAVNTFKLYAKPWRVTTFATIDSRTQMANELGLDPYSESIIAIQAQYANERHYEVLAKAKRLAANNQIEHDFQWADRSAQMNRSQIWSDFGGVLAGVSQQMAIDTMNHGITHLYVGKMVAAQFMALPREIFEPSGTSERPGIFRVGRLLGRYEVYYTPKGIVEAGTSAQILCIGRATDVTRNPFILGDAVAPTVIPLAVGQDLRQGAGFYSRGFTSVNPHGPSALGCALINVINLK
ncbi:hypothetical protein BH10PSE16_BH10PSE16_00880 [soil metagenome]